MPKYTEENTKEITQLLLGRKVAKVSGNTLSLDNGKKLCLVGNEGCYGCTNGNYRLSELSDCDNVITSVEFVFAPGDDSDYKEGYYQIFVFAGDNRINLATFMGTDGNGCYGTGYTITVTEE